MARAATEVADALRHQRLLDALVQPAVLVSSDYRILGANRPYRERFANGEDVCGHFCYRVSHRLSRPCSDVDIKCPIRQVISRRRCSRVMHLHRWDGGFAQEEISTFPLIDAEGRVESVLEIFCPHCEQEVAAGADVEMVGNSPFFNRMMALVAQVARTDTPVLLLGESGTGKGLAARAIHDLSRRSAGRFVAVACTEIAESLLESELFGHEKGSFTGASSSRTGLIESSDGGTLFLDEIGDMSLPLQVKLLRVLDNGVFRRVGSSSERGSDFRLICATHRDLRRMVSEERFRHDLYYRLSVFPIHVPPLRDRSEDLPLLIDSLRRRLGCGAGCRPDQGAMKLLFRYSFPGNVRELSNILQRACLLADGDAITPHHLPVEMHGTRSEIDTADAAAILSLEEIESRYLRWAATTFGGTRQELAQELGLSERSLYRKLRRALEPS